MRGSTNDRTDISFFSSINSYSRVPRYYWLSLNKPLPDLPIGHGWLYHSAKVGWRPIVLMPGFLIGFAILSCLLIAILEFLLRRTEEIGAIAFVDRETLGQPSFVDHCFNFGPLIFAIAYALLFASIDHEIKRLEPYFQLSKPEGATADDSLLMSYPYIMAIKAPFVAFRKRQDFLLNYSIHSEYGNNLVCLGIGWCFAHRWLWFCVYSVCMTYSCFD